MRHLAIMAVCAVTAACTTPDVAPGIKSATGLMSETGADMRLRLAARARQEFIAAENLLIREQKAVLRTQGPCDIGAARRARISTSACKLNNFADPTEGPINASQIVLAVNVLDDYWQVLGALADAQSRDRIQTLTKGLLDNIGEMARLDQAGGLARLAGGIGKRRDLIVTVAGVLVDQYRTAALRRVVRRADPVIEEITVRIASYYDTQPGGSFDAGDALIAARTRLENARTQGSQSQYRNAIAGFRDAFSTMIKAEANSPVNRLLLMREAHQAILDQLMNPSLEDYLATFEMVREIRTLANKS